jgi:hypothetical protein
MCDNIIMNQGGNIKLPDFLLSYFWDVEFKELRIKKHASFVIKRLLDRGNLHDIRWLLKTYGKTAIKQVVMETKDLSRPTCNFWADMLGLDKSQVRCLQKPYSPIHFGLSS